MTEALGRLRGWLACEGVADLTWLVPASFCILLGLDESPDVASAGVRAGTVLLTAVVLWTPSRRRARGGEGPRRVAVLAGAWVWAMLGAAVLAELSAPPLLWIDGATLGLAILLFLALHRGSGPAGRQESGRG